MSGILSGKVWLSDLDPELKPLAATLADIANDDGTSIYPSIAYIAWRLSRSRRSVDDGLSALREIGVLMVMEQGGGRTKVTEYRMIEENLPKRGVWDSKNNHATVAQFDKPRKVEQETTQSTQETTHPSAYDPSLTVSEPSSTEWDKFTSGKQSKQSKQTGKRQFQRHQNQPQERPVYESPAARRDREAREQVARVLADLSTECGGRGH